MCDTRQRDASTEAERDGALTQVPLQDSTEKKSDGDQEGWRRIAQLAEMETDPDKLMDLAQQLVNELDREAARKAVTTWKSEWHVNRTPKEGR